MFMPPPRAPAWRRHSVAAAGALFAFAVTGRGLSNCTRLVEETPQVVEEPFPTLFVPVTMTPPPKAAEPAGRGGGGSTKRPTPRTRPPEPSQPPPAEAHSTTELLAGVDVRSLGRASRDGGPGPGGPGPIGAGQGLGGLGTGSGAGGTTVQDLQPLYTPSPSFPRAARDLGLEALCSVTFHVNRDGRTTRVGITKCDTAFHDAIERAALKWRFEPKRVNGKRVPALMTKRIRFIIR